MRTLEAEDLESVVSEVADAMQSVIDQAIEQATQSAIVAAAGSPCACNHAITAAVAEGADGPQSTEPTGEPVKSLDQAVLDEIHSQMAALQERIQSLESDVAMLIAQATPELQQI